jgi:hypothetical protein
MKNWKPLAAGVAAAAVATATLVPRLWTSRSVRFLPPSAHSAPARFDRAQSAALFVGVRRFMKETLDVPYAVDDAVDLAYAFALDPRVSLVLPEHVVLALSGAPQKEESRRRLEKLINAGAQVQPADQSDILLLMQQQASAAGRDGIFIASFATHGFIQEGTPYVLGSASLFRYPETAVSTARIFDIAATSRAERSLLFIDACRERLSGVRGSSPDPSTAAPVMSRMRRIRGQVVFYAAAAGKYAYDTDGNGVFTKAVLDGLSCKATAARGVVTVGTLRIYVEREVRGWIRKHRDPSIGAAIQVSLDGDTHNMPLSVCLRHAPDLLEPTRLTTTGSLVTAYAANGKNLWSYDLGAPVLQTALFRRNEIVAMSAARLTILDSDGHPVADLHDAAPLQRFVIDRPTARHAPKLIVGSTRGVFLIDAKKLAWRGILQPASERVAGLEVIDHDNDSLRDIAISTTGGNRFYVDFAGKRITRSPRNAPGAQFTIVPPSRGTTKSRDALLSRR